MISWIKSSFRNRIFVTNKVFAQETVAFFATADIVLLAFVLFHHVSNPFEASVNVIHFNTVLFSDSADGFSSNDSFYDIFFTLNLAKFFPASNQIINEHQSSLVTVQKNPFAFVVLNSYTNAVCIRI